MLDRYEPFRRRFRRLLQLHEWQLLRYLGTSVKGARPPIIPGAKGQLPVSSFGGSRGTPTTDKRKLGSLFTIPRDLMEGELDPVANKRISHLVDCFLHSSECISTDMAIEGDRLDLNERYSRALKACHDVSAFVLIYIHNSFFFSLLLLFFV